MKRFPLTRAAAPGLSLVLLAAVSAGSTQGDGRLDSQDPEPEGAQVLAEEVLRAPWNSDKTTRVSGATSRLQMNIMTLIDRTIGIDGFRSPLTAGEPSLEERIERLGAKETSTELRISLAGSILFDFGKAELRPDAQRTLEQVAAVLAGFEGRPVRVEGHTDSIGSEAANQKLSERRATAVRDDLESRGVVAARLRAVGYGESRAAADNATAAGRQINRRVEVVIEKAR